MPPVASTINTLSEYATAVLSVAEDALADTDAGTPERSTVTPAAPTFDCCPQLTVHVSLLAEAPTSPTGPAENSALRSNLGALILATYVVTVIRCAPVPDDFGGPPTVVEIGAVAHTVLQDGWALWNGLRHAYLNGQIFEHCTGVHFDRGVPIREQGTCVGWEFTIRAHVPGIPNPGLGT